MWSSDVRGTSAGLDPLAENQTQAATETKRSKTELPTLVRREKAVKANPSQQQTLQNV